MSPRNKSCVLVIKVIFFVNGWYHCVDICGSCNLFVRTVEYFIRTTMYIGIDRICYKNLQTHLLKDKFYVWKFTMTPRLQRGAKDGSKDWRRRTPAKWHRNGP